MVQWVEDELLPVLRTPGLGGMMELEVADGTTEFQPRQGRIRL
jgi:hypothetical protein